MEQHKKILILTGSFPPSIGITSSRMKSIVKYLYRDNWDIHVVTSERVKAKYEKESFLNNIKVYKIFKDLEINPVSNVATANNKKIFLYDKAKSWVKSLIKVAYMHISIIKGYKLAKKVIEDNDIDIIYCTVPYITLARVGEKLKRKFKNKKFVLEIRDVITGNEIMEQSQTYLEKYTIRSFEKRALKYVDDFIFLTRFIKGDYVKRQSENKKVLTGEVITNGYDCEAVKKIPRKAKKNGEILFAHVGSFYGSRNPLKFLKALGEVLMEMENIKERVLVEFVGAIPADIVYQIDEICKKYNMEKNIIMMGKIAHEEALEVMVNSSINVLITHETGSEYAIPGKIFEYIGTKRPILALSEDILVKELMEENKLGYRASNKSIDDIKATLKNILENIDEINIMELDSSNKFSCENQVKRMEEVFQKK